MVENLKIPTKKKIFHTKELMDIGFTYYKINKMVKDGKISKLNKSYYENNVFEGEDSDFYYVSAYAPDGVVCLMSAAVYYGLSNYRPDSIDVAIPKNKNISTLPEWPTFNLYYFEEYRYETGISDIKEGENEFRIYNIEKTVIDIIYYRNKVGIEETKEILSNYLNRDDRNINQLVRYSEFLRCYDITQKYLEVLI